MSADTNKAIVKRYFEEVWNHGRLELVEEFFAEEVVEHSVPRIPGLSARDSMKAIIGGARETLANIQITVHDAIAEGDTVAARWSYQATHQGEFMGVPSTGKTLTTSGAAIYRLAGAQIVEIWNFPDNVSIMQQLGLLPIPEAA
jgi:steroid delta-isomerase-like uncharacterized protein